MTRRNDSLACLVVYIHCSDFEFPKHSACGFYTKKEKWHRRITNQQENKSLEKFKLLFSVDPFCSRPGVHEQFKGALLKA